MTIAAIIVAAGRGTRAGGDLPKQWQMLAGVPVLAHAVRAFGAVAAVGRIVLVLHPEDMARAAGLVGGAVTAVTGGATRAASVRNALESLEGQGVDVVLIHDAARPLISGALIGEMIRAMAGAEAAAPALAVTDALWRGAAGAVAGTVPRDGLWRAQTPQTFAYAAILAAHRAHPGGAADDVEVARAFGMDVAIIPGEERNLKLTFPGDLARAEEILRSDGMDIRVGNGFDVHRFRAGDHLWLCGVQVPFSKGLEGHSDADVGMHALTDAIYGALAQGDIGQHFPPADMQWKGAASHIFLRHACGLAAEMGFRITGADVTLICERPKIGPHAVEMRGVLAGIMGLDMGRVSVKATTSEKLGFTGREEGIAAMATATLVAGLSPGAGVIGAGGLAMAGGMAMAQGFAGDATAQGGGPAVAP